MAKLTPEEYVKYITRMNALLDALESYNSFDEIAEFVDCRKHYLAQNYLEGDMSHAMFHSMNDGYNHILDYARVAYKRFEKESKEWFEKYGQ